jgi:hypothetical protein
LRELLKFSDLQLAQKVHELEKYGPEDDPVLGRFRSVRTDLSRMSWNSFVAALGDCDAGPLSRTGVMTFPLDEGFAERLTTALLESPKMQMRREDFAMGYVGTASAQCEYLNACNEYRELTPQCLALLTEFLSTVGPQVEQSIGHRFRIGSTRQFQLVPERIASGRHLDGWPVAIRKVFILPQGCGRRTSTTWFRQRDGKQLELESEKPIWVIFENSVVWHAAVSAKALRPTVEFDILPARETCLDPFFAGLAGWYPWFPTDASLLEGTRLALARCFPEDAAKGWISRLRRRFSKSK